MFGKDGEFLKSVLEGPPGAKLAEKMGYENTLENHFKFIHEIQDAYGSNDQFMAAKTELFAIIKA